jgi:hypothetical protein
MNRKERRKAMAINRAQMEKNTKLQMGSGNDFIRDPETCVDEFLFRLGLILRELSSEPVFSVMAGKYVNVVTGKSQWLSSYLVITSQSQMTVLNQSRTSLRMRCLILSARALRTRCAKPYGKPSWATLMQMQRLPLRCRLHRRQEGLEPAG